MPLSFMLQNPYQEGENKRLLEEAVKVKAGVKIISRDTTSAPYKLTKGEIYTLEENAIPIYKYRGTDLTYEGRIKNPNDPLSNCDFPILDDSGKLVRAYYGHFSLVEPVVKAKPKLAGGR